METVLVYFTLGYTVEDDDPARNWQDLENDAAEEIWCLLASFSASKKLGTEGHDRAGDLVCFFLVEKDKIGALAEYIRKSRGGGDDIIYLDHGFSASNFTIVSNPGMSSGIPVLDWEG